MDMYRKFSTGLTGNKRKLVLNRDNHPIFDATNCVYTRYYRAYVM
jgi:hypothetical protein